ncbi:MULTISPECIES: hypothetical protein [Streptomyces]|nr:hypothetical protein [Streptomyces sp. WM6349]KOU19812.1 hypothetical protein ADK49_10665 [Streptomyces sp. WM6349]KOV45771.1 hypothetical protein ADK98_14880 [Streptomyces sp. H036]
MMKKIEDPAAEAVVSWRSAEEGGRRSGPPTAPVYAATAVFVRGEDQELRPGRPPSANHLSVLLEETPVREDGSRVCKVDFLVRDLATPHLVPGGEILVMEGPRVVASALITAVHVRS